MIGIGTGIAIPFVNKGGGAPSVNPDFVFTVDTTQAGSAADTIVLPLTSGGTFSGTIDWGDTSTSELSYANRSHTYAAGGTYTITISGDRLAGWTFQNAGDKAKITEISNWGLFEFTDIRTFQGCSNMDITATDIPTITGTNFTSNFYGCSSLTTPDFSAWDTSNVTSFQNCFQLATQFNGKITNWVQAVCTNVKNMMHTASAFNKDIDWNISGCTTFATTENMFTECHAFDANTTLVVAGDAYRLFNNCNIFTGKGVETWDVSAATTLQNTFIQCDLFNGNVSGWDISSLLVAKNTFFDCDSFDRNLSAWDIDQITNLSGFMQNATGLSTANYDATLVGWEANLQSAYPGGVGYPNSINVNFGGSQYGCEGLIAKNSLVSTFGWTITDGGQDASVNCNFVSTWDTTQAGSASDTVVLPLLSGGTYLGTIDWGDGGATSSLSYANRSHTYASSGTYTITISGTMEGWQFANGGDKAKITDISNFGNLTITTAFAFQGANNMTITATDAPILATTTMQGFMQLCSSVTTFTGVALMNSGSVTNWDNAFSGMTNLNQSFNGLDMSSATNIGKMFKSNSSFANGGDALDWSIPNSLYMRESFRDTQYAGTIDFGQTVTDLGLTLYNNDAFDANIENLDVASLSYANSFMQAATGMSTANYDATLIGWEATLQAAYPSGVGYPYSINIHFGGSQFTSGGAGETAKNSLVTNFGWTISDGGGI